MELRSLPNWQRQLRQLARCYRGNMKYIFTGLSLKGLAITIDLEKLKTSQDRELANDFLEVVSEKGELEIGDLKFKFISVADEKPATTDGQKRRKF